MQALRRAPRLQCAGEPQTPRLCVSRSIAGCLAAVLMPEAKVYVYLYRGNANKPKGVWDSVITGERWVVPPASLTLYTTLPASLVRDVQAATRLRLEAKQGITWKVRLAQYVVASRLTSHDSLAELWWSRYMNGVDPEEYILTW